MKITNAVLEALRVTLDTSFQDGLGRAPNVLDGLYTPIKSTTSKNTYGFLGAFPIMREWTGPKRVKSLDEFEYDVKNKPYESTIAIKRDDIEDDNIGLAPIAAEGMGEEASYWRERELIRLIKVSTSTLCYDGQYFFDTDHPVAGAAVSNMGGNDAVQPYYFLHTGRTLKPFIFQTRKTPVFVSLTDPTAQNVFLLAEYLYGVEARGAAAFGMWQMAHRRTDAVADAAFQAARTAMASITNDEGEPLGIEPDTVLFGASNRAAMESLFEVDTLPGGAKNPNYKKCRLVYSARLP
jgi:phage major head subunit gpT-like protein